MFNIIEKFLSVDGEGPTSGELATFIRFFNCNLRCSWCDTTYSWDRYNISEVLSARDIYDYIKGNGARNVTLTGGEPLIQDGIENLLDMLNKDSDLVVHIETNGSIDILPFKERFQNISFIVDYKLPKSGMTNRMNTGNLKSVEIDDVYKFVVGSREDLDVAYSIIKEHELTSKCLVYFSPVLGEIEMETIVDFMKEKKLNEVRLQVQLHKVIWDKDARGV
ncbi:putative 7-carboxy-7-deazaguanine synthase QueE [Clostridium cylindrosporum]|uniref:7-carboxy-7-deazaguanine synthase n=1 Tax=Clostridium cylindrosporum DSM 605 TaxID=1121307 RepID=A0A0J8D839_CLOCY|nr:putative 7-carboxy-7-deazaguanine synthase QueE [Clostridium cylindrosporum]KMT22022.1 7-carboxy-7-deazaguanine synthase QueE [Clostridium cylindrosporum DSM 605]